MSSEDKSYENSDGSIVFTSVYLKKRGTCCKSACLHCPFGYTLKKCGIQFADCVDNHLEEINKVLKEIGQESLDVSSFLPDNIKFILIKDQICGFLTKNHIVVKNIYLRPYFQDQGISKELVESYYFI